MQSLNATNHVALADARRPTGRRAGKGTVDGSQLRACCVWRRVGLALGERWRAQSVVVSGSLHLKNKIKKV
jgi:hypothetical protein